MSALSIRFDCQFWGSFVLVIKEWNHFSRGFNCQIGFINSKQKAKRYEAVRWMMVFAIGVTVGLVGVSDISVLLIHFL